MLLFYDQAIEESFEGHCEDEPVRAYSEENLSFIILCNIISSCIMIVA